MGEVYCYELFKIKLIALDSSKDKGENMYEPLRCFQAKKTNIQKGGK